MTSAPSSPAEELAIVYDGDCPFCSGYVRLLRLREAAGPVRLINARDGGAIVEEIQRLGYDLDRGMVLKIDGRFYHGAECMNRLGLLSSGSGIFNRLNRWVFRHARLSRALYPVLRSGRNVALRVMGRRKIGE